MSRAILRTLLIVLVCALAIIVVPRLLGYGLLSVQGGSMGEALPNGTLVITETVAAKDVKNGNVIVVRAQGTATPVIHRVVALEQENGQTLATTKGDANTSVDPGRSPLSNSVAVPAFSVPYLGFLLMFVATPLGWLLGIALPAALIGFFVIRNIWDLDGASRPRQRLAPADSGPLEHWTHRYRLASPQPAPPLAAGREQTPPGARQAAPAEGQAAPAEPPDAQRAKPIPAASRPRPDRATRTRDPAPAHEQPPQLQAVTNEAVRLDATEPLPVPLAQASSTTN